MSTAEHYTYRVQWSTEDAGYIGTVAELPSLSWVADSQDEAFSGIRTVVADVIADMLAEGEIPPPAIADRRYSGKFMVRVTPEVHRRLALEAAEQQVSLNRLAAARLLGPDAAGKLSA
ncbi:type II toxin-antitoxin system HicB family antitoxin [Plantibacter sp. YIM 135347]|uniref:type II toxin-antitoxin system HicB family antitoxin n=1 Tax=Plantibacter sp. YIM 135347 TaxID=3423919 RepID=UPI003D358AA6